MSRKATLDALFGGAKLEHKSMPSAPGQDATTLPSGIKALGAPNTVPSPKAAVSPSRVRSGAIGAMGASLQQLKDDAEEATRLRQSIADGDRVIEVSPSLIDPAPVADRIPTTDDPALQALAQSIAESGQQVPVLIRPHPSIAGRWQAAYGHRRIRACAMLERPVRAVVRPLSDVELAIAQGKENAERRDLSFIEKARFALGLEEAGFDRNTIAQALAADRADLSRYLAISRAVPEMLVRVIGPAPKTGRARWQELLDAITVRMPNAMTVDDVVALLPQLHAYARADSDGRFRLALTRLRMAPPPPADTPLVTTTGGQPVAQLKANGKRWRIELDEVAAPGFAAYLAGALPDLYARWQEAGDRENTGA